jgi:hypothetical protein
MVICAAVLTVVVLAVRATIQHREYLRIHRPLLPQGHFPIESIVGFCLVVVGEAAVLWRLLTGAWATIVRRALVAFGLSTLAAFGSVLMTHLHDPPTTYLHVLWLLGAAVIALSTLIVTGAMSIVRSTNARDS